MLAPPLDLHSSRSQLVGVVHLGALPGAPRFEGDLDLVIHRAEEDANLLAKGGLDALVVENFGDVPFFGGPVPSETIAAMARAVDAVRRVAPEMPIGVNVLRNDARSALGLCAATGASFLRVNVHAGTMHTDQGTLVGCAADTLRERARLAPHVAILADVHVKHATPPPGERLIDAARDARLRGLADALVISGRATGSAAAMDDLVQVREALPDTPLFIGSGLNPSNAAELLTVANGAIVATCLEVDGVPGAPVDPKRVVALNAALGRS
jgi:uncharacterized protein